MTKSAYAAATPVTIGSGDVVFASEFSLDGAAVNLAGASVDFTGSDPAGIGRLVIADGSFNGAFLSAITPPGGDLGRIDAHGLVIDTGPIVASGKPEAPGHLTIDIAAGSSFVQEGSLDLFYGGSLRVDGPATANFINDATLDSTGGVLDIGTNLSGSGTIIDGPNVAGQSGNVELGGVVQAGETVDMAGGVGLLQLDRPLSFLGAISNFEGVDQIDLKSAPVIAAAFDAHGDLLLSHRSGPTDHLQFENPPPTLYVSNLAAGAGVAILGAFGEHPPGSIAVHPHGAG